MQSIVLTLNFSFANLAPDKVEASITPDLLFQAHSSVLDLVFYEGDQFPAEFKGSAFVALKGSWNRSCLKSRLDGGSRAWDRMARGSCSWPL